MADKDSTAQGASPERRQPSRILIIESDATRAKEYFQTLNGVSRLEAQWVAGKLPAFERLKSWKPQLLLIGDELDDQCGLELTVWIRKYTNAPIMVVTTNDNFDYYLKTLNSGADGCIYHPVPAPLLIAQLLALLRRSYRYSVLVEKNLDDIAGKAPHLPLRTTTNTPPLPIVPAQNSPAREAAWPTCHVCNYTGPQPKFRKTGADGSVFLSCPVCLSTLAASHSPS
jgi:DNA-binding response OmpR family regulator